MVMLFLSETVGLLPLFTSLYPKIGSSASPNIDLCVCARVPQLGWHRHDDFYQVQFWTQWATPCGLKLGWGAHCSPEPKKGSSLEGSPPQKKIVSTCTNSHGRAPTLGCRERRAGARGSWAPHHGSEGEQVAEYETGSMESPSDRLLPAVQTAR